MDRCLWVFHVWPKWEDLPDSVTKKINDLPVAVFAMQSRRCETCDKLQLRREQV